LWWIFNSVGVPFLICFCCVFSTWSSFKHVMAKNWSMFHRRRRNITTYPNQSKVKSQIKNRKKPHLIWTAQSFFF
jgi:hypothetical protein